MSPQPPQKPAKGGPTASYFSEDTIAAPASAFGGAVGIVRVSGPEAFSSLGKIAVSHAKKNSRVLTRAVLKSHSGAVIDEAMVATFASPGSFTGEDCVEYHLHGNPLIATQLLSELSLHGVRRALPGEFSFRAVRNGKMTLPQATGIADLITAANSAALSLALEKLSGQQNQWIETIAENLRSLLQQVETSIDFSDQGVGEMPLSHLANECLAVSETLERLARTFERGSRIQRGVRVAFLGLPNAGKSTLFNALLGEDRSIVSEIPGTTRDVVGEHLSLSSNGLSVTFRLEDTAGLRQTEDRVETIGVERSRRAAREADLVVFVVDASNPELSANVKEEWQALGAPAEKTILVLAKTDLAGENTRADPLFRDLSPLGIKRCVTCSAHTGSGVDRLVDEMVSFAQPWYQRDPGEFLLTQAEQAQSVRAAVEHLSRAARAPELELLASDLKQSLHALAPLIGTTVPDDILNSIFSRFCIGK